MCPTARQDNAQIFCSFLILLFFSYLQSLIVLAQGKFATDLYNGTRTTTLACSEAKVGINLFLTFTPLWRAVLRTSLFFIQVAVWLPHDVALKKRNIYLWWKVKAKQNKSTSFIVGRQAHNQRVGDRNFSPKIFENINICSVKQVTIIFALPPKILDGCGPVGRLCSRKRQQRLKNSTPSDSQ